MSAKSPPDGEKPKSGKGKAKGGKTGRGKDKKPRKNSPLRPDLVENEKVPKKRGRPPGPPVGGNAEQKRATAFVMFAKGATVAKVAKEIGCSESTIYGYLEEEEFKAELKKIYEVQKSAVERVLRTNAERVAHELVKTVVRGGNERASSVSAAKVILDYIGFKPVQQIEVKHSGGIQQLSDAEVEAEIARLRAELATP